MWIDSGNLAPRACVSRLMRTLICLLAVTACAWAADATGKWTGKVEIGSGGETHEIAFQLRQSGTELTGVLMSDGRDTQVTKGKVQGPSVTFQVQPGDEGPAWTVNLTLDGDDLNGSASAEREGEVMKAKVTLKRSPPTA
jgi:hypothetical protein